MTVYTVSGPTLTLLGNGANNTGNLLVADCVNPITGTVGPVIVKITNSSNANVATVQWGDGTVPTYTFANVSGTASGSGANAKFNFTVTNAGYSATIANAGVGYIPTETITIPGASLGGTTPTNNATVTVASANVLNAVNTLDNTSLVAGTGYTGGTGVATTASGSGTGLTVNTTASAILGSVLTLDNGTLVGGSGYALFVNPVATTTTGGGTGLTVDITASAANTVASLDALSLVPGTGYSNGTNVPTTAQGLSFGTGLTVDITQAGGIINSVAINQPGSDYNVGDTVLINGGNNDAYIDILTVNAGGAVTSVAVNGVGSGYSPGDTVTISGGNNDATIDVLTTNPGGSILTVAVNAKGQNYTVGETITISGGNGDATIDVLTVTPGGQILTISVTGTRLWPQPSPEATTYVLPNSTDFVQINGQLATDSYFIGNCASGNMYITPVQIVS